MKTQPFNYAYVKNIEYNIKFEFGILFKKSQNDS